MFGFKDDTDVCDFEDLQYLKQIDFWALRASCLLKKHFLWEVEVNDLKDDKCIHLVQQDPPSLILSQTDCVYNQNMGGL